MSSAPKKSPWKKLKYFLGFDWGNRSHHVVLLDPEGNKKLSIAIDHDAAGWHKLRRKLIEFAGDDLSVVGVAIENRVGPAVEKLLEFGCTVYPLNPKAAARYRERQAPSGTKDDQRDAWALADALRIDGQHWRAMDPEDPLTQEIRLTVRDEVALIEQRTAAVNALQAALHEYYPAALEAFGDWTSPAAWAFIERFPTPKKLVVGGKRAWDKFLHAHKLFRPQTYDRRIECFRHAMDFCGGEAVTAAKSLLALSLVAQLQAIEKQLKVYRQRINELFDRHPSRAVFDSLPGLGEKLAPRVLGETVKARQRFDKLQGLECCAGVAPVRFQSGQVSITRMRRACIKSLRYALHLWANASRRKSVWAEAYYQGKRREGKSHACALRCLARRWVRILWKLLETGDTYNEAYHLRNQISHGSWVLQPGA